ncbi:MAG: carbonic anhydrase [Saprospiraceae bacterium]|nr:carbonic anhydrase [Saprospiraceae bacterium]
MKAHSSEIRKQLTPQMALEFLKEGNARFLRNLRINRNFLELVNDTAEGQSPFAAILSCSDSRTSVELIFDQGLGDIFSVRLAGNIASINAIASIEYACKVLGVKLIVYLGHTNCGAIKGACDKVTMGNLGALLDHIHPAVDLETETFDNRTSQNKKFVENVTHLNIQYQMQKTLDNSDILRGMIEEGKVGFVGAIYNLATGKVTFDKEDIIFDINHVFSHIPQDLSLPS